MDTILKMSGIVKKFGDLVANDHINIELKEGEILAILGENGAGKTTLMNVLYGLWQPEEGDISFRDKKVIFKSPKDAILHKIGMVSQHFSLVPNISVFENITLGKIPVKKVFYYMDKKMAIKKATELAESLEFKLDVRAKVEDLSVGEQQRVEILKALYQGAEVLILDEPTAVLTSQESDELFKIMHSMTAKKRSILFITHKLREAMATDRIVVLRAGEVAFEKETKSTTREELTEAMFGKSSIVFTKKIHEKKQNVILSVSNLLVRDFRGIDIIKNVTFDIHSGEVFGVAGVAGNGQRELAEAVMGLMEIRSGEIFLKDKNINNYSTKLRRENGIAYIPEERRKFGSVLDLPGYLNFILGREDKKPFSNGFILNYPEIFKFSKKMKENYSIKMSSINALVRYLSGGNLQKLVLSREFSWEPDLIIAAQPSRGLDVKTTNFVHDKLLDAASKGKAILLISYDLDEIFKLSDKIGVMFEGKMTTLNINECERREIESLMIGHGNTDE